MAKTARAQVPAPRFILTKSGAGYVTADATSGLEWSHTLGLADNQPACQALVDALNAANHGGHADWRLPTYDELNTIAIAGTVPSTLTIADAKAFPGTHADWHWSSTPSPGIPNASRGVHFGKHAAAWLFNRHPGYVRAVRGTARAA